MYSKKILGRKIEQNLNWLPHRRKIIKERNRKWKKKVMEKEVTRSYSNALRKEGGSQAGSIQLHDTHHLLLPFGCRTWGSHLAFGFTEGLCTQRPS